MVRFRVARVRNWISVRYAPCRLTRSCRSSAFQLHRPPLLDHPPSYSFPTDTEVSRFTGELWVRYPSSPSPVSKHIGSTTKALLQFRKLLHDIALHIYSAPKRVKQLSLKQALFFRSRLQIWFQDLPTSLESINIAFPCHLKIQ